ncbi:hypothetical protein PROFUN_06904 [Planoprotostelium fungivorum]|uniref:Uncharacterized protein n=1 Tax=Planoprotostelium fungivorum TaxID=1890364 RepID=A0A2P6NMZ5_9EUKA|nr:hypothetical protein PROFUN_06904 [Planoprotostelium fungivorum]
MSQSISLDSSLSNLLTEDIQPDSEETKRSSKRKRGECGLQQYEAGVWSCFCGQKRKSASSFRCHLKRPSFQPRNDEASAPATPSFGSLFPFDLLPPTSQTPTDEMSIVMELSHKQDDRPMKKMRIEVDDEECTNTSQVECSLQDYISEHHRQMTFPEALCVAKKLEESHVISFRDVEEIYGNKCNQYSVSANFHATRVSKTLLSHLPVVLHRKSTKEGWWVYRKSDDPYSLLRMTVQNSPPPVTFFSSEDMAYLLSLHSKSADIIKFVLACHLGRDQVERQYGWKTLDAINEKMKTIEKDMDTRVDEYLEKIKEAPPTASSQKKQMNRMSSRKK